MIPAFRELRQRRNQLRIEMRSAHGSVEEAQRVESDLSEGHRQICRELERTRRILRRQEKTTARAQYYDTMPTLELEKQVKPLRENPNADLSDDEDEDETGPPPIPEYGFGERRRIVEAFYGSDAEPLEGGLALQRRIQHTKDLVALCRLWEPPRRGPRFNWNLDDEPDDDPQEDEPSNAEMTRCPTDVCIVCLDASRNSGRRRPFPVKRVDSLCRHLVDQHLKKMNEDMTIRCTLEPCKGKEAFSDPRRYLAHAWREHEYDIRISERHLECLSCNSMITPPPSDLAVDSDDEEENKSSVGGMSMECEALSQSVSPDNSLTNIDPRLL